VGKGDSGGRRSRTFRGVLEAVSHFVETVVDPPIEQGETSLDVGSVLGLPGETLGVLEDPPLPSEVNGRLGPSRLAETGDQIFGKLPACGVPAH
jgi:hypothetical protein